jgi:hypothetical protein
MFGRPEKQAGGVYEPAEHEALESAQRARRLPRHWLGLRSRATCGVLRHGHVSAGPLGRFRAVGGEVSRVAVTSRRRDGMATTRTRCGRRVSAEGHGCGLDEEGRSPNMDEQLR